MECSLPKKNTDGVFNSEMFAAPFQTIAISNHVEKGAAQRRGSILSIHPAAPGSILGVRKN